MWGGLLCHRVLASLCGTTHPVTHSEVSTIGGVFGGGSTPALGCGRLGGPAGCHPQNARLYLPGVRDSLSLLLLMSDNSHLAFVALLFLVARENRTFPPGQRVLSFPGGRARTRVLGCEGWAAAGAGREARRRSKEILGNTNSAQKIRERAGLEKSNLSASEKKKCGQAWAPVLRKNIAHARRARKAEIRKINVRRCLCDLI